MKLLTFLGAPRKYHRTTYVWREKEFTTKYAPAATCHFLQPDQVTVFLTEEARDQYYPDFLQNLPEELQANPVSIPMGKNTDELWNLFNIISDAVQPGEEVAFDITHGLRAFPYMSLLAAAFLRSGLNVKLEAVLYGAFEVRDESATPNRAPVFDLSPMIKLLEWSSAADRFNRTGDARYLASLISEQRGDLANQAGSDRERMQEVGHFGNLAGALESISQSLRLLRPYQSMEYVAGLEERIELAKPALERSTAHPLTLLLDSIIQTYQPLGQENPADPGQVFRTLETERNMLHWYAKRNQWMQAVSLAREWLVSWIMAQLGFRDLTSTDARSRIESVIGMEASAWLKAKQKGDDFQPIFLDQIPREDEVLDQWHKLTQTRNDIDHAAKRDAPMPLKAENLIRNIEAILAFIDQLPLEETA